MRIAVDSTRCQGHSRCALIAEDLFTVDDLGYAQAAVDGAVPPGRERAAQLAVANCPEQAILIVESE